MNITTKSIAATGIAALVLAACGGGGAGSSEDEAQPPAAPTLALGTSIKTLVLEWAEVAEATHYRLFEERPGLDDAQLGGDIPASTLRVEHTVPLWTRAGAQYRLQACNAAGCTDAASQTWSLALRNAAIGYAKASNTDEGDRFGGAIALSADGRTLAVGASNEDGNALGVDGNPTNNTAPDAGAVYVYTRDGGPWVLQAYLKASNTNANDFFGSALGLSADGDTLVVGALGEDSAAVGVGGNALDNAAQDSGAAYVFQRNGGSWSQTHYVKADNTRAGALFGGEVAVSGDGNWLVVAAYGESGDATGVNAVPANYNALFSGAAYVFERTATSWAQRAYLKSNEASVGDAFGAALAISHNGSRVAVGAPFEAGSAAGVGGAVDNALANSGAAFLYARDGEAWSLEAYVKASNPDAIDQFGTALALAGDGATLAVGAIGEDSQAVGIDGDAADNSSAGAGAAYVFDLQAGIWAQRAYVKASNTRTASAFGNAMALSHDGRLLAVGARGEDNAGLGLGANGLINDGSVTDAGAIYLLDRVEDSWALRHYLKAPNANAGDIFGVALSLSADGSTLAVGATGESSNATGIGTGNPNDGSADNAGAVYLY